MRLAERPPWKLGMAMVAVLVLAGAGYVAGRALTSSAVADPPPAGEAPTPPVSSASVDPTNPVPPPGLPGPDDTPEPGATPDRSKPFWYIPYENQERLAPKFVGELNGITFDDSDTPPDRTPPAPCSGRRVAEDWIAAIAGTPFALNPEKLPAGMRLRGQPEVTVCDDGRPIRVWIELYAEASVEGVGAGGSTFYVVRLEGVRTWPQLYSEGRLSAGAIAGRPAVFVDQILEGLGESAIFIVDDDTGGSTRITAVDSRLEHTIELASLLYE